MQLSKEPDLRLKVLIALAQISLGMFLAWGSTLVLTLLLASGDSFDGPGAFAAASLFCGVVTFGFGVVSQEPTAACHDWLHKAWDQTGSRGRDEPDSPATLTALGVALVVAPQLLLVGALVDLGG